MKLLISLFGIAMIPLLFTPQGGFEKKNISFSKQELEWGDPRAHSEETRELIIKELILEIDRDFYSDPIPRFYRTMSYLSNYDNQIYSGYYPLFPDDYYIEERKSKSRLLCDSGADACFIKDCEYFFLRGTTYYSDDEKRYRCAGNYYNINEVEIIDSEGITFRKSIPSSFTGPCPNKNISSKKCRYYVNIAPEVFERGYSNLDPNGDLLYSQVYDYTNDWNNIRYQWAIDIKEAVAFLLFHEYGHAAGLREQAADEFARSMIMEYRKKIRGLNYKYRDLSEDVYEHCNEYNYEHRVQRHSFEHKGTAPPSNNLPPGIVLRE